MTEHIPFSICRTIIFSIIVAVVCWLGSLPRTFNLLSIGATISTVFTAASLTCTVAFLIHQGHPANLNLATKLDMLEINHTLWSTEVEIFEVPNITEAVGDPIFSAHAPDDMTFTSFMVALLDITYSFIGQMAIPNFIFEMKEPRYVTKLKYRGVTLTLYRDFPKALWACTVAQTIVYGAVGIVVYKYTGKQYMTSPAFGGLEERFRMISFSLMVPTIVILGALFASLTGRLVFFRVFDKSRHLRSHTLVGWLTWSGILGKTC